MTARSSCGIFPDVRGMWGYRPGCSCQRCQTCFAVIHLHQSLRRNFCRCAPELHQTHYRELAGGIRSTPQVSWLVSGINTPEGSCVAEEFCCSEFVAALLMSGRMSAMVEYCLLHVISVGVCVLFAGFTSTSDVFQNVRRLFETFVWDHRRCAPMMLCLFAARFTRRPERLFTFCKSR